jgi:hypothetical protein
MALLLTLSMGLNANGDAIIGLQKPQWGENGHCLFSSPNTQYYNNNKYG